MMNINARKKKEIYRKVRGKNYGSSAGFSKKDERNETSEKNNLYFLKILSSLGKNYQNRQR